MVSSSLEPREAIPTAKCAICEEYIYSADVPTSHYISSSGESVCESCADELLTVENIIRYIDGDYEAVLALWSFFKEHFDEYELRDVLSDFAADCRADVIKDALERRSWEQESDYDE